MNETDERLPKNEILRRRADFDELFRRGKRWHGKAIQIVYWKAEDRGVAFLVSKRVGKAVIRNRIRRRMREIYRKRRQHIGNYRMAILAKPAAREAHYSDLIGDFESFLAFIGVD